MAEALSFDDGGGAVDAAGEVVAEHFTKAFDAGAQYLRRLCLAEQAGDRSCERLVGNRCCGSQTRAPVVTKKAGAGGSGL